MKKDLLSELEKGDRFLKMEAVDKFTKKAYQGFERTINIIGKVIVRIQSKRWDAKDQQLFILKGAEKKIS